MNSRNFDDFDIKKTCFHGKSKFLFRQLSCVCVRVSIFYRILMRHLPKNSSFNDNTIRKKIVSCFEFTFVITCVTCSCLNIFSSGIKNKNRNVHGIRTRSATKLQRFCESLLNFIDRMSHISHSLPSSFRYQSSDVFRECSRI